MKKITLFKTLTACLLLAATLLSGCSSDDDSTEEKDTGATEKPLQKIMVAESARNVIGWMPIYVASSEGFFEEEGLDVSFTTYNGGTIAIPALIAGDAQFCQTGYDQVLKTYEAGQPTKIIMANTAIHPWKLYGAKEIESISDLKGKVISGSMPGSSARAFVMACLKAGGLDPVNDVTYVQVSSGANVAALDSGQIYACMASGNAEEIYLRENGYPLLTDLSNPETHLSVINSPDFPLYVLHVTNEYADKHPETVQAFMNAVVKGLVWISEHSATEIYDSVTGFYTMERETGIEVTEIALTSLSRDGYVTQEGHDAVVNWSINMVNYITNYINIEDIYDGSYLDKAWANAGK